MIDAVLLFGLMNVAFEFVLLCMLKPRIRLRLLGNTTAKGLVHVTFLLLNLAIHWGTLIGTMSAVLAFICSLGTMTVAHFMFGSVVGTRYTTGLIRYSADELV